MSETERKPEWAPAQSGAEFASRIVKGVERDPHREAAQPRPPAARRRQLSATDYVQGVLDRDRTILARAITLVESNSPVHLELAQEVLQHLLPHTGQSIRVGITGVPGVGKSTFIESLGCLLCERDYHVAVLAVDPSSSVSGGSILGDKTRMEGLSRQPHAFIRPSPTGGALGGVTRKSRETILVCEAAGFNVILVETVGVGQSEIAVRSMVDFFLLLMLAGAGDELQGLKKGNIELADALVVTKADGDNVSRAEAARLEFERVMHVLTPVTTGWRPPVLTCSALNNEGIAEVWAVIEQFRQLTTASGVLEAQRQAQVLDWMRAIVEEHLHTLFFNHPEIRRILPLVQRAVLEGKMPPTIGAQTLLNKFEEETS
ncbi:MAG: methylmalonyl Co-A mutase-associated GTPase MeaB [Chloroflexota bacterium]